VEKSQVRLPLPGRFGDVRKTHALEELNGILVAFARPATRLLGRPVQPLMENPTHMIVMEANVEMTLNQHDNASTGPQLRRPTVDFGPLQQKGLQTPELFGGQAWRRTGMRSGRQTVGLSSHCQPTVNGSAVDVIGARDNLRAFATIDRLHRTIAPPLE